MRMPWIIGTLVLLAIWFLVTATGLVDRVFLPCPDAVFRKLLSLLARGDLLADTFATLWRTLLGFVLGCMVGVCVGLLMGAYRPIYETMESPVDFFRSIPASALFPLFIVIWGLGNRVQVFIAAWASSMVVLINTMYGIRNVGKLRLMVAKIKKIPPVKVFYKVMIPEALPYIVAGARIALSLSFVVEIVAEMFLGVHSGLGRRIFNATSIFAMEEAYAAVFLIGILGWVANKGIILAERRVVHWSER